MTYTPNADFTGSDSFTFVANDGKVDSNVATITLQVLADTPTNTPPSVTEQALLARINTPLPVTLSGSDADNDPLTFRIVTQPKNGTLSGTSPNLIYTPKTGFVGTDSFTLVANDGKADSAPGTITVQVVADAPMNSAPLAQNQSARTKQNTPLVLALGATDANGDALKFRIVSQPKNGKLSGSAANLTYTPNAGFIGSDSFTFVANDGKADSNLATVSVQVLEGDNGGTVTANADSYALAVGSEEQAAGVTVVTSSAFPGGFFRIAAPGVLGNDRDSAGGTLQARIATYPTNTVAFWSTAMAASTSWPVNGFVGADEFTYLVSNGTSRATAKVTLNITDQRGPELRFDTPRDGATLNAVTEIKGRVRDLSTPLVSPTLLWRRFDGKYWNGNAWVSERGRVDFECGQWHRLLLCRPSASAGHQWRH